MLNQHWRVTTSARKDFVRNLIVEHVDAENARDMQRTLATYSDDCVFDDVPTQTLFEGKDSIGTSYLERFEAYPNLQRIITRMTVDDDSCVVEITMSGPQEKPYRGFPPNKQKNSELKIVGHFEINQAGLITRETAYYDQLAAAIQLGALPDITKPKGKLWLLLTYPYALVRIVKAKLMH